MRKELSVLVEAAQSGDSEVYDALLQRFQQMAYATAYRYLGDHHLAQDIVQEAMIEAFLHLQELKEPGAFPGWFRQIVFRQCTRALRQTTLWCTSLEAVNDALLAEGTPDTSERANRSSDGAEISLMGWWSWLIRWVKAGHSAWQTRSSFG